MCAPDHARKDRCPLWKEVGRPSQRSSSQWTILIPQLTHNLINPSVQSCLYLLPFKETSCAPNSTLASASGKSNMGQLVPRVAQKSRRDKMEFRREIIYHATGNKDPMRLGRAHSPPHQMAHLLKLSKT